MTVLAHLHAGVGNDTRMEVAVLSLHVAAAAVWIGGVLIVLVRRVAIARAAPIVTVAALTTIVTGVVNTRLHIDAPMLLLHRAYGWVFVGKLVAVGAALVLGHQIRSHGRRRLLRVEAPLLGVAASAGVALAVLPGLTSTLPGLTVVAARTSDPECASQIQGAFAAVHELRPTSTLRITEEPASSSAIRIPDCTASTDDVAATAALVRATLSRRGRHDFTVVVDDDPRGQALARSIASRVVDATTLRSTSVDETVVIATGWAHAQEAIDAVRSPTRTVLLAPWLLRRTLLAPAAADTATGQLTVVSALDPTGAIGRAYVRALAGVDQSLEPTDAGLRAYRAMRVQLGEPVTPAGRAVLLTPAAIAFLPAALDHEHVHGAPTSGWLPVGDLATIS